MILRDYQQDLLSSIFTSFSQGYHRPLVVAPCGAGKTYIMAELIRRTKGECLVLTHRQELKQQHEKLFHDLGITNVRVAMILTEANRLGQYPCPVLCVADEAHLSRSMSWLRVLQFYNTYTVGFTATPVRLDGKPLNFYDTMVQGVDVRWLIENKRLAPYEYYAPTLVDTSGLRTIAGDYVTSDLEQLMNERAIYGDIINCYERFASGERTICYCVSVKHARETADAFSRAGLRGRVLSSETPPKQRSEILGDFRAGRIDILCNVGIISEGVSIDEVSCVILARPTESVALGIQQMMRCMRYLPGKTAKIIDCVGNYTRIGLPDDDRSWSLDAPTKKRDLTDRNGNFYIRCCPECFMTFQTAPKCPFCGAEYPLHPREIQAKEEIELRKITAEEAARVAEAKKAARVEQGRAQSFEDLIRLGRSRGYKNPAFWASQVMRGRRR